MFRGHHITVVIPARNEALSLPRVLADIPTLVDECIVVDNGSRDATATLARAQGATVLSVPRPGYGRACLAGAQAAVDADILVFLDADYSDHATQLPDLLLPMIEDGAELVIGSRVRGQAEPGALSPQQRWGNALACWLIGLFWGHRYTDLGPFRAIHRTALLALEPRELTFGWTVEMQIRALKAGLKVAEVPVDYRRRIGRSQISGTVRGTVLAGYYILACVAREAWRGRLSSLTRSTLDNRPAR